MRLFILRRFSDHSGAGKTFDALGTECFLDKTAVFHHTNFLQVRLEGALGRLHRETPALSKLGFLTAILALCHF